MKDDAGHPIRVGIVGADASGQGWAPLSHLPALKLLPGFELAAVCTRATAAAAGAAKYGRRLRVLRLQAMVRSLTSTSVSVVVKVPFTRRS
jgi:predicted dehydrogenase